MGAEKTAIRHRVALGGMTMGRSSASFRALLLGFAGALLLSASTSAAETRVMISGGVTAAFDALVPEFEKHIGNKVLVAYGPSMGSTANAIPVRLERGEPADVLIVVGYALSDPAKNGKVVPDSEVELVKSASASAEIVKSGLDPIAH
jgi:molybdate transport system substrate-binding protein